MWMQKIVSFVSQSTGSIVKMLKGSPIGRGAFATVFQLLEFTKEPTGLVGKEIQLNLPERRFNRKDRLLSAINELTILKKLGRLKGYGRKEHSFLIVTKNIEGRVAYIFESNKEYIQWLCFRELRALHRKNIAHLDPHLGNFIISPYAPFCAQAIDFGLSQEATFINCGLDFFLFYRFNHLSLKKISKFYFYDLKDYIKEHCAQISYHFFILILIVGMSLYGFEEMSEILQITQEVFMTLLITQLGKEINSSAIDRVFERILAKYTKFSFSMIQNISALFFATRSFFSLYFMSLQVEYHWQHCGLLIQKMVGALTNQSPALCLKNVISPPSMHTVLLSYTLIQGGKTLPNLAQSRFMPEWALTAKADLLFQFRPLLSDRLLKKSQELSCMAAKAVEIGSKRLFRR